MRRGAGGSWRGGRADGQPPRRFAPPLLKRGGEGAKPAAPASEHGRCRHYRSQAAPRLPQAERHRPHRRSLPVQRCRSPGTVQAERPSLHLASGGRRRDRRRLAARRAGRDGGAAARRHGGHRSLQAADHRALRQAGGGARGRPVQARSHRVPVPGGRAGRELPQDAARDGARRARHPDQLADRLHNMRTLDAVRPETRRRVARETLEIYAPIANRLGLDSLFRELQELAFANLYPARYKVLAKAVKAARGNRREVVNKILKALKERLQSAEVQAHVTGREKHIYSIYNKMHEKHLSFSQVLDIYGFRVVVEDVPACYLALGALHSLYKPVPGTFKDYIAIPKVNGYQSLHTTLIGPYGMPVEVQIRTQAMNRIADAGVASHWLYKSSDAEINEVQQRTHKWLQSLLDIQHASGDPAEFLEHIKVDLFPNEVYVFTPQGKILAMPRGATAVDFAYAVHTDIGNRCAAARINYELRSE